MDVFKEIQFVIATLEQEQIPYDAHLQQHEADFFALIEKLQREPLPNYDSATVEALRYAFRMTWIKNDFASIVQAGENLPEEVLCKEVLFTAYLAEAKAQLCANDPSVYASLKIHPSVSRLFVASDSFDYSDLDPADWDEARRFIAAERARSLRESEELAKRLEENE